MNALNTWNSSLLLFGVWICSIPLENKAAKYLYIHETNSNHSPQSADSIYKVERFQSASQNTLTGVDAFCLKIATFLLENWVAGRDLVFLITRQRRCPSSLALPMHACCPSLSLSAFPHSRPTPQRWPPSTPFPGLGPNLSRLMWCPSLASMASGISGQRSALGPQGGKMGRASCTWGLWRHW